MAGPKHKLLLKPEKKSPGFMRYCNKEFVLNVLIDPRYTAAVGWLLLAVELCLNVVVIQRVRYTEIDWVAYMQECEGFLNGTWDYSQLKGDTGPLVYPAGFVYIYSGLYYLTSRGTNIRLAQYVFLGIYLAQLYLVFRLYARTRKVPPYALVLTTLTSYRIHSIYVLRLFNDPLAVLLAYASFNAFISSYWWLGTTLYTLAVSVKMNILLYAPCLLLAYITSLGIRKTICHLALCGCVQLLLAAPFLYTNALAYLQASFDIGRVFEHRWTVNYRFFERILFENRTFHAALLVLHVTLLLAFAPKFYRYLKSYAKLKTVERQLKPQLDSGKKQKRQKTKHTHSAQDGRQYVEMTDEDAQKFEVNFDSCSQLFVLPMFVTNFIGVVCARSLHYQFYTWYFHSLPYLVHCTGLTKSAMFLMLAVIEYCWNCYPSTDLSSALLHVCHVVILYKVYKFMSRT
ncbi:ALG3 alpha-13- mannosyltransferase [Carabus blaptoides fortunei]